jgi:hypothetical protein
MATPQCALCTFSPHGWPIDVQIMSTRLFESTRSSASFRELSAAKGVNPVSMGTRAVWMVARTCAVWLPLGCTGRAAMTSHAAAEPPAPASSAPDSAAPSKVLPECFGGESWRAGPTAVCNSQCRARSFVVTRCVESRREDALLQAPCECGPSALSPELSGCRLEQLSLVPLQVMPRSAEFVNRVDGCQLELACQPGKLTVTCDGEEDGTGTSLCECYRDGQTVRLPRSEPWPGEGAETCHAAAALCLQATR